MAKYRKKPVEVEATQYLGKTVKGMCRNSDCFARQNVPPHVHTIHDNQRVDIRYGDYVVMEPDGEHAYPIKPDIFDETYEKVKDQEIRPEEQETHLGRS